MQKAKQDTLAPSVLGSRFAALTEALGWRTTKPEIFRNWAGNIQAQPRMMARPRDKAALQKAVQSARQVRVMGSGHSFNAISVGSDLMLHSEAWNRILELDLDKCQVKVEAGIKLKDLNLLLWQQGLAFPNLGDIAEQSMAGLVSTGTHGTGYQWGSFSDARALLAMELILADGSLVEYRSDKPEDAEIMKALRLGLGAFGVIYSLRFQLEKAHHLCFQSRIVPRKIAMNPQLPEQHDHFEFFTFPFSDQVFMITRDRSEEAPNPSSFFRWLNEELIENFALNNLLRLSSLWPSSLPYLMRSLPNLAQAERFVGRSYEVMASVRKVKFYEMEYAFPLEAIETALDIYESVNDFWAKREDELRYLASFPGEVRFLGGDQDVTLSPTQGRKTAFLAAHVHPAFGPRYQDYFRDLEQQWRGIGGRPHWGKLFYRNPQELYPGWQSWEQQRQAFDPQGKFLNPFLRRLIEGRDGGFA